MSAVQFSPNEPASPVNENELVSLLREADRHQCRMTLVGDRVKMRAPKPLPDELLSRLRQHRSEVIDHLRRGQIIDAIPVLLKGRSYHDIEASIPVCENFLDNQWQEARSLGWTDEELFACYPDPAFASIRYDYAGPLTMAALTGHTICAVEPDRVLYANGLACRRVTLPVGAALLWAIPEPGKG